MNRVLWILLVISLSVIASVLGATLANALKSRQRRSGKKRRRGRFDDDEIDTTRNAPKGAALVVFWVFAGLGSGFLVLLVGISLVIILTRSVNDPNRAANQGEGPNPHRHEEPIIPPPAIFAPQEKETQILGGASNPTFRDHAPDGGVLIGFDVGLGRAFGVNLVKAIQPIYRTQKGEIAGREYGRDFNERVSVRAKPGYAVGAVNVKAGLMVNGISVIFMRVKGNMLDPADAYSSPWIGDTTGGGGPTLLAGDGTAIIGIIGKQSETDCMGIGLLRR